MEQRDLQQLRALMHQLKGAGGGYGFDGITELASTAEEMVKREEPVEAVRERVDSLVQLIRSIEGYQIAGEKVHA
jgi:hypothetical protein